MNMYEYQCTHKYAHDNSNYYGICKDSHLLISTDEGSRSHTIEKVCRKPNKQNKPNDDIGK